LGFFKIFIFPTLGRYLQTSALKNLLLPKVFYIASVIPSPTEFIKSFQAVIFNFLWKGTDKIARKAAINNAEYGGFNVTDFESSIKSARLAWITRFFSEESYPWKAYLLHLLKDFGGDFFLYCNYDINDYNICSVFYKEMLLWWSDLRAKYNTSSSYKLVIWNNHEVRVNDDRLPIQTISRPI